MPLYEYECTACHKRTEKRQKFSDPEITVCPHCNGPLERVLSAPAISFKGGGWYADGYGNKKSGGSSTSSESKPGTDTASKPAASSDAGAASTPAPAPAAAPVATPAPSTPAGK